MRLQDAHINYFYCCKIVYLSPNICLVCIVGSFKLSCVYCCSCLVCIVDSCIVCIVVSCIVRIVDSCIVCIVDSCLVCIVVSYLVCIVVVVFVYC